MFAEQEIALSEMFRAQAEGRRRELTFFAEMERTFEKQKIEQRREEREHEKLNELQRASDEQIAVFRDHLDHYDTATVQALMDNEEALDKARQDRERIEASALRLPDGRMVFKTEDGQHVIDQYEREVPRDVVEPASIPNDVPSWEKYKAVTSKEERLEKERDDLHRYQQKLDDARDTINQGDVSKKQLDALDADLQASMPDAVKQQISPSGQNREANLPQADAPPLAGMAPAVGGEQGYKGGPSPLSPR